MLTIGVVSWVVCFALMAAIIDSDSIDLGTSDFINAITNPLYTFVSSKTLTVNGQVISEPVWSPANFADYE